MTDTDTRDPAEIEREIRRTQDDMSRTVDRIGDQMTPRTMLNALLDKADENGVDARWLLDGARRNPIALGLISAGAIWLVSDYDAKPSVFTSGNKSGENYGNAGDRYRQHPEHSSYVEHMARITRSDDEDDGAYLRRRDEARGTYFMIERDHDEDHTSYRQRLDEAAEKMRERRDSFLASAHDTGSRAVDRTKSATRRGGEMYQEHPLVGGLAAALLGAVAGSAIPVSRTEREKFGALGAEAIGTAEDKAREVGEELHHKKDDAVASAKDRMQQDQPQTSQ